ncbi:MAG TPA: glycosyltransferase, partial [Candidatus Krumholzibacterium sp.]|nr:glycosyltransferase [Candidatus Krumholzibacterium sp.]
RLAERNRVLYVEPLSLRFPGKGKRDLRKMFYRLAAWTRGPRRINGNLLVYSPVIVPLHGSPFFRALNRSLVRSALRRIQKRHGLSAPLLWAFLPTGADMIGQLGERLVIYHCVDDYSANPGVDRDAVQDLERRMLERADIVLTTSPALFERCSRLNPSTWYHPNVADAEHFSAALDPVTEVPPDLERLPSPRVGFVGNISGYKVDIDLVARAARSLPHVSFVMIGPVGEGDPDTDVSALLKESNVTLMGEREYEALPAYLKGIDVCIIPFRDSETTRSVFPMKFFEYLAAGRPVVVTGLPALAQYGDNCYTASGPEDFVRSISLALEEDGPGAVLSRTRLAAEHSWPERIETLSGIISERLSRRDG